MRDAVTHLPGTYNTDYFDHCGLSLRRHTTTGATLLLERVFQFRYRLKEVRHEAVIGDLEDRC
ncbi:MAG: hypothetical protein VXZ99_01200, partial [Pseudomonadota bacterium]|nr:hypothetical protein [Pseudomonadota bacterium]